MPVSGVLVLSSLYFDFSFLPFHVESLRRKGLCDGSGRRRKGSKLIFVAGRVETLSQVPRSFFFLLGAFDVDR